MKPRIRRDRFFHNLNTVFVRFVIGAALSIWALNALARPRDPLPPLPEFSPVLFHESFDEIYSYRMTNAVWVVPNYGTLVESWSDYALHRTDMVTPFIVPGLDSAGHPNIASEGELRLWVKPYWSSAPDGKGPGKYARLLELAVVGNRQSAVIWSLEASPDGSTLSLLGQSDAGPVALLEAGIGWQSGEWHLVALNYGPKGTALFLDGQLAAEGAGTLAVPPKVAALAVGSTLVGTDGLLGELDEICAFGRPLSEEDVAFYYGATSGHAVLGPITAAEDQARREAAAKRKAEREAAAPPDGGGVELRLILGGTSECITNVPLYITNIVSVFDTNQGWTVTFDVQGTNGPADIFTTTNLAGNNITNSQWVWLEQGPTCSTYQYTNQPDGMAFYVLGDASIDPDGDGLSTAYELLISHTDPNVFSNPDTDGDGLSDAWEIAHGMNPQLDESNPQQQSFRKNYQYDAAGWLRVVSGIWGEGITLDAEGNVQQVP